MSDKVLSHAAARESLTFSPAGETPKKMDSAFFRGENCNFNPYQNDHLSDAFCKDFILKGWLPPSRFIASSDRVTAFGSCFAENITQHLIRQGFDTSKSRDPEIYVSMMGEGLVNVYALLQQFEWALENTTPPKDLWHGFRAESFGYDETVRLRTRDIFLGTDVFIVTFGLSEIWYDEISGGIFWRAVPMDSYDPSRHKFRVCGFDETKVAVKRIFDLIKRHVPQAKIVFTLSPIPLAATFRPQSCVTANSASKALLRAAIDEFMRESGPELGTRLFYFPAYEIVSELFPCRYGEDGRHLLPVIVPAIMKLFEAYYCQTPLTTQEAENEMREARRQSASAVDRHPLYADRKS
jgi:hypothetical protein